MPVTFLDEEENAAVSPSNGGGGVVFLEEEKKPRVEFLEPEDPIESFSSAVRTFNDVKKTYESNLAAYNEFSSLPLGPEDEAERLRLYDSVKNSELLVNDKLVAVEKIRPLYEQKIEERKQQEISSINKLSENPLTAGIVDPILTAREKREQDLAALSQENLGAEEFDQRAKQISEDYSKFYNDSIQQSYKNAEEERLLLRDVLNEKNRAKAGMGRIGVAEAIGGVLTGATETQNIADLASDLGDEYVANIVNKQFGLRDKARGAAARIAGAGVLGIPSLATDIAMEGAFPIAGLIASAADKSKIQELQSRADSGDAQAVQELQQIRKDAQKKALVGAVEKLTPEEKFKIQRDYITAKQDQILAGQPPERKQRIIEATDRIMEAYQASRFDPESPKAYGAVLPDGTIYFTAKGKEDINTAVDRLAESGAIPEASKDRYKNYYAEQEAARERAIRGAAVETQTFQNWLSKNPEYSIDTDEDVQSALTAFEDSHNTTWANISDTIPALFRGITSYVTDATIGARLAAISASDASDEEKADQMLQIYTEETEALGERPPTSFMGGAAEITGNFAAQALPMLAAKIVSLFGPTGKVAGKLAVPAARAYTLAHMAALYAGQGYLDAVGQAVKESGYDSLEQIQQENPELANRINEIGKRAMVDAAKISVTEQIPIEGLVSSLGKFAKKPTVFKRVMEAVALNPAAEIAQEIFSDTAMQAAQSRYSLENKDIQMMSLGEVGQMYLGVLPITGGTAITARRIDRETQRREDAIAKLSENQRRIVEAENAAIDAAERATQEASAVAPETAAAVAEQAQAARQGQNAKIEQVGGAGISIAPTVSPRREGLPPERIKSARWFESAARNRLKELQDKWDAGREDFTIQEKDEFDFLKTGPTPEQVAERYGYGVATTVEPTAVTTTTPPTTPAVAERTPVEPKPTLTPPSTVTEPTAPTTLQPELLSPEGKTGEERSTIDQENRRKTEEFINRLEDGEYQVFDSSGEKNGIAKVKTNKSGRKVVEYVTDDGKRFIGDAKSLVPELNFARFTDATGKEGFDRGSLQKITPVAPTPEAAPVTPVVPTEEVAQPAEPIPEARPAEPEPITRTRTIEDAIRDKDTFVFNGQRGAISVEDGITVFRPFGTQEKYEVPVTPTQTIGEIEGIEWARKGQRKQIAPEPAVDISEVVESLTEITQDEVDTAESEFEPPAALVEIEKSETLNFLSDLFDTGESKVSQEGKRAQKVSQTPEFYRQVKPDQINRARNLIDNALRIIDAADLDDASKDALAEPFLRLDQDIDKYEQNREYKKYKASLRREVQPTGEAVEITPTVSETEAAERELEQRARAEAERLEREAQSRRVAAGRAAFVQPTPTEALGRVVRGEAEQNEFESLVERGYAEEYNGQQILTQSGIDLLPEAERPRLTPEARKIQIDTRVGDAAAEAISKGLRIGVDQVPPDARMPEGWTLEGDVYIPPTAKVAPATEPQPTEVAPRRAMPSDAELVERKPEVPALTIFDRLMAFANEYVSRNPDNEQIVSKKAAEMTSSINSMTTGRSDAFRGELIDRVEKRFSESLKKAEAGEMDVNKISTKRLVLSAFSDVKNLKRYRGEIAGLEDSLNEDNADGVSLGSRIADESLPADVKVQRKETEDILKNFTPLERAAVTGELIKEKLIDIEAAYEYIENAKEAGFSNDQIRKAAKVALAKWREKTGDTGLDQRIAARKSSARPRGTEIREARREPAITPQRMVGMEPSAVEARLQELGFPTGGIIRVVNEPDADFEGRAIILDGKVTGIELNAAAMRDNATIDRVLNHEFAESANADGALNKLVEGLTPNERKEINDTITRLGYSERARTAEEAARAIEVLADAWRGRGFFTRAVARIEAWASKLGFKLTRRAAEYIAARNLADINAGFRTAYNRFINVRGEAREGRAFVTPEENARFLELAKDPEANREELQKMVEDAARRAGYDIGPVWHGGADGFTVFDWNRIGEQGTTEGKGFYFSNDRDLAAGYADRHGGRLLRVYLRSGKPIDGKKQTITQSKWRQILRLVHVQSEQYDEGTSPLWNYADVGYEGLEKAINEAVANITETSESDVDAISGFINGGADPQITYDAIYKLTGMTGIVESEAWGRDGHTIQIATSANHVKLADPVTYDASGNVIPLNERFQPTTPDIRYARKEVRESRREPEAKIPQTPDDAEATTQEDVNRILQAREQAKIAQNDLVGHSVLDDEIPEEFAAFTEDSYENGMSFDDFKYSNNINSQNPAYNQYVAAQWLKLNGGLMPTVKVEGLEISKPEKGTAESDALRLLKRAISIYDSRSDVRGGKELTYSLGEIMATWMESGLNTPALRNAIVQYTNLDVDVAERAANSFAEVYRLSQVVADAKSRAITRIERGFPAETNREKAEKRRRLSLEQAAGTIDAIAESIRIAFDVNVNKPRTDRATERQQIEEQLRQAKRILKEVVPPRYLAQELAALEKATGLEGLRKVVNAAQDALGRAMLDNATDRARKAFAKATAAIRKNEIGPDAAAALREFVDKYRTTGLSEDARAKIQEAIAAFDVNPIDALADAAKEKYRKRAGELEQIRIDATLGLDVLNDIADYVNTVLHADKVSRGEMLFNKKQNREAFVGKSLEEIAQVKPIANSALVKILRITKGMRGESILNALGLESIRKLVYENVAIDAHNDHLKNLHALKFALDGAIKDIYGFDIGSSEFDALSNELIEVRGTNLSGETGTMKIRRKELWDILGSLRDPDNMRRAVQSGGFVVESLRAEKLDTVKITADNYIDLLSKATDKDNQLIDFLHNQYNTDLFEMLNDSYIQSYGHGIKKVDSYYPRNADWVTRRVEAQDDLAYNAYVQSRVDDFGPLKERDERARARLVAVDAITRMDYHINNDARISAYLPISKDVDAVLGEPKIKEALIKKVGQKVYRQIVDMARQQMIPDKGLPDNIISTLSKNVGVGVLGLKIHAAIQNPVGIPIAVASYGTDAFKYIAKAFPYGLTAASPRNLKQMASVLGRYAPYYNERYGLGGYAREMTSGIVDTDYRDTKFRRNAEHAALFLLEKTDQWGAYIRYRLAIERIKDTTPLEQGTEEFDRAVAREWTLMMFRSENTSHGADRTGVFQFAAKHPFAKFFIMFQSAVSKQFSMAAEGLLQIQQGGAKNRREGLTKLAMFGLSVYTSAAISSWFYGFMFPPKDEEEEKKTWLEFFSKMISAPISAIPVLGNFISTSVENFGALASGKPEFGIRRPMQIDLISSFMFGVYDTMVQVGKFVSDLSDQEINEITGDPKYVDSMGRLVKKALGPISMFTGVPFSGGMQLWNLLIEKPRETLFGGDQQKRQEVTKKIKEAQKAERQEPIRQEVAKIYFAASDGNQKQFARAFKDLKEKRPNISLKDVQDYIRRREEFLISRLVDRGEISIKNGDITREEYLENKALLNSTLKVVSRMWTNERLKQAK